MATAAAHTERLATALMLSVAQIVNGSAKCAACDRAAAFTVMTGADPEPEPMCYRHMAHMMSVTQLTAAWISGAPGESTWSES